MCGYRLDINGVSRQTGAGAQTPVLISNEKGNSQIVLIAADIAAAVLIILYEVTRVRKVYAKRKEAA